MKPCSINIVLLDGDPTGIGVAQISLAEGVDEILASAATASGRLSGRSALQSL